MNKNVLRSLLKKRRARITPLRKKAAGEALYVHFVSAISSKDKVLSFANFSSEIETCALNHYLAAQQQLYLPKICGSMLDVYQVLDPEKDLIFNRFGIQEPNPLRCKKISPKELTKILVPGLGFDRLNFRIGYGKGFYDRFLCGCAAKTIGIGFQEQLVSHVFAEKNDLPLEEIMLF